MRALVALLVLAGCQSAGPSAPDRERPGAVPPAAEADRPGLASVPDRVHRDANAARRDEGAPALGWSDALAAIAAAHSRDMAARDYFAHDTPEGTTPNARALAAGVDCRHDVGGGRTRVGVSENLYQTTAYRRIRTATRDGVTTREVDWFTPAELAAGTVGGWLESPGHRRNLLDPLSREHGVGVAVQGETVYVTQVLC